MQINEIPEVLEDQLPEIVKKIAEDNNVLPYIENPDFLEPRLYPWHQFGLLTHTKQVRKIFLREIDEKLKKWGLSAKIEEKLSEKIEKIEKKKLLEISIPLHDLGKILVYGSTELDREHELVSANLLSQDFLRTKLQNFGLSEAHINYIAKCIETHNILGKQLRNILKHAGNLRLDYVSESNIKPLCVELSKKYKDIKIEIGIFFFCDLLGKTSIRLDCKTDLELQNKEQEIEQTLKEKHLQPELKKAVMQLPVNLKLIKTYLNIICKS